MKTKIKKWLGIEGHESNSLGLSEELRKAMSDIPSLHGINARLSILEFQVENPSVYKKGDIHEKHYIVTGADIGWCFSRELMIIEWNKGRPKHKGKFQSYIYYLTHTKTGDTSKIYWIPKYNKFIR